MSTKKRKRKPTTEKKGTQRQFAAAEPPIQRGKNKRPAVLKKRKQPNWPVTALAGGGMALTLYLVLNIWLGNQPLYCAEGSSCDILQQSRWGTFLGMPTAFWGFWTYATLAFIALKARDPQRHWKSAWLVAAVGLGYSIYLTMVSIFVIDAVCAYCLISLSLLAAIFVIVLYQRPEGMQKFTMKTWVAETGILTLIIVGAMHLYYSGVFDPSTGPKDPYLTGLARHLQQKDAVLYGAFW